jgi:hypothetical protein
MLQLEDRPPAGNTQDIVSYTSGGPVRCPRCGNDNPDGMRFCGMCGGTLLSSSPGAAAKLDDGVSPAPEASAPATATATRPPALEEPRRTASASDSSPSISGPSFLGLNDAPAPRKRGNLSIDPQRSGSRNLDYLLQDEEEHRGGGAGKFFLIVLALALAVGFGYLRWKNQLPWLNAGANKPTPATQTSDQPAGESSTPASPSITPEAQPAPNQTAGSGPAASPVTPAPNTPTSSGPAASNAQPPSDSSSGTAKADPGNAADNSAATKTPAAGDSSADKPGEPAAKSDDSDSDNEPAEAPPAATSKPKPTPPPAAKPRAATRQVDSVAEAQRYLYGRGAAQDCEHGLRILKPLATQGDAKAMVEMGALYSAGLCTPHDLPTAYRWFAIALRKDPSNQAVQTDLQKLWGEMTQPERQLAIKLTQ